MKLREYQNDIAIKAAYKLLAFDTCYLSMECRTGKTITALSAADNFHAKRVLFITKLKAIPSIKADYEALKPVSFILDVINYESAHKAKGDYDLVIIDEAHSLGAYPKPSKRTQEIKTICEGLPVLYLSGTPSPESYSQLYHQFWVCSSSPWKEYKTFYKWAKVYVSVKQKKVNGYFINDYSHADKNKIDRITKDLFISYSQEQAGFDVKINEHILTVPMNEQTERLINTMRSNLMIEIDGNTILGDSPAKLLTKLHQLSSGTVIAENGLHLTFDKSKAEFVRKQFAGKKVALFYVYQSEAELLQSVFPNWTDSPEEFQDSSNKVFISQVRRAREGVRLDTADALIFFNLEFSYLSYEQGRNRLVSKERTVPAEVYFLCSDCGIESKILDAVHGKQDFTLSYYGRSGK